MGAAQRRVGNLRGSRTRAGLARDPGRQRGNISAYWAGYKQYKELGRIDKLPRMMGFQAAGAAPLVTGQPCPNPETVATAIRIGNPVSAHLAKEAVAQSEGEFNSVTDEEILAAQYILSSKGGVFAEPASCAPLAGLIKLKKEGACRAESRPS